MSEKTKKEAKALSEAELDAVTGGGSDRRYEDQKRFGGYKCRSCGTTFPVYPDGKTCPQCGQHAGFMRVEYTNFY